MTRLQVTINGEPRDCEVAPSRTLAHLLRYDLGLTGTKIGCEEAECGACTVLVDGQPVDSCIYPALKVQGCTVQTIEGLASPCATPEGCADPTCALERTQWDADLVGERRHVHLHPLQQAFVEQGATQCGFCSPGFIMVATALLARHPQPTDEQIRTALKDTYCRCTGYQAIINAIKQASGQLDTVPLPPTERPMRGDARPAEVVGQPLPRPDAVAKVTGTARYTDDYRFPGMLFGATKRAMIPHARIVSIDISAAEALPGVHAVLTWRDVPGEPKHGLIVRDWPVLCGPGDALRVRYVGDAVALVAAESQAIADQARDLIEVVFEPLPIVVGPLEAYAPGAPAVHDDHPDNVLKHISVRKGDVVAGFAEAEVIVEREYRTPIIEHAFLEPECAICRLDGEGRYELYVGSQIPFEDRRQVAESLGAPEDQVRIIGTLVGGGFGGKEDIAGQIHAALLARATGRPVKLLYTRHESLLVHPKRHATIIRIKTGARRDGTLTAVQATLWGDTGAYASLGDKVMTRATTHAAGPYDVPHVTIDCYAMLTNNPPAGAFRGFGVTQSAFAAESNMDLIAHAIGMDPLALRRKNALRVGALTNTGQLLRESVGLLECLERVEGELRDAGNGARAWWEPVQVGRRVRAWGLAAAYKNTGLGGGAPDRSGAEVEVFEDGSAIVRAGGAEIGQGLNGVVVACAAEELGLPFERVQALMSDTDLTPDGGATTASRQTFTSGNAARLAAAQVREMLALAAAERLNVHPEVLVFQDGLVRSNGTAVPLGEVVRWAREEGREPRARVMYEMPATQPLGTGGDMHVAFSYAAQAALVEVDLHTGGVQVLKLVGAFDVGRAINPLALLGQLEGGSLMGVGYALTEEFVVEQGRVVTDRLGYYKMPSIRHAPEYITHVVEHATTEGPYGAKGVGEISSIPTAPAIINAIFNACGVRIFQLPADQDSLLCALKRGHCET